MFVIFDVNYIYCLNVKYVNIIVKYKMLLYSFVKDLLIVLIYYFDIFLNDLFLFDKVNVFYICFVGKIIYYWIIVNKIMRMRSFRE